MKILIVHSYYFPDIKGGAEYSIKKLAEGLHSRGHEVTVLCDEPNKNSDDAINGVVVHRRTMHCIRKSNNLIKKIVRGLLELYNPFNKKIIENEFKKVKPDVIYTNCLEHISPIVWKIAKKNNIRIVDTQRVYTLLVPAGGKYHLGTSLWKKINRHASNLVDCAAFISHATKKTFIDAGFYKKSEHIVICNSIDFDLNDVLLKIKRRCENIEKQRITRFVFLGTLNDHKGIHILLDAFLEFPDNDIELHIAGSGPLENMIIEKSELDKRIVFHGWLSESDVFSLLEECDILVCPSIWPEPFGRVVLDAYKQGMPVIASRAGGLAETVINGETGILVMPNQSEILHNAMRTMIYDKKFYICCCKNIENKIEEFSITKYLDSFEKCFLGP